MTSDEIRTRHFERLRSYRNSLEYADYKRSYGEKVFAAWRPAPQEQLLYHVHYIDPTTGLLMECPDVERCKHRHTCPIHGCNVRCEDIYPIGADGQMILQAEGMLNPISLEKHHAVM